MYAFMHACMHACMYVCMYERTYVRMHVCIYVHIHQGSAAMVKKKRQDAVPSEFIAVISNVPAPCGSFEGKRANGGGGGD